MSSDNVTLTINMVTSPLSVGDENIILKEYTVPPGESYTCPEIVGHVILANGFISTIASSSDSLVIRASGREIS